MVKLPSRLQSLSTKIILWMLFFIIIPVSLTLFYTFKRYEAILISEVSERNLDNLSRVETDMNSIFDNMVRVSTFVFNDYIFKQEFGNAEADYYERSKKINGIFSNIMDSSIIGQKLLVTIFDEDFNVYSNWNLNFNQYREVLSKPWVQKSIRSNGLITWGGMEDSFIKGDKGKMLSMARTIFDPNYPDISLATLIVSIKENEIKKILKKYLGDGNTAYIVSWKDQRILTSTGEEKIEDVELLKEPIANSLHIQRGFRRDLIGEEKYLINVYKINKSSWIEENDGWSVVVFTPYDHLTKRVTELSQRMLIFFSIFVFVLLVVVAVLSRRIVLPIKKLDRQMQKFNIDKQVGTLDVDRQDEIGHLNRAFYDMADSIQSLFNQLVEEYEIKEKYKFESLRAQLNPHFLFNTLNTIRWMAIIRKADNIVESIDALAAMLKYSMSRGGELVALKEELENIRSYVFIQNSRYGSRINVSYEVEEKFLSLKVIKFMLQPVVENAIIHAFNGKEEKGFIRISAEATDKKLILSVSDNGAGMESEQVIKILSEEKEGKKNKNKVTGIGLRNVSERIRVAYGDIYGLKIKSIPGEGTTVIYTLPIIEHEVDESVENTDSR